MSAVIKAGKHNKINANPKTKRPTKSFDLFDAF